ncbi:MAG: HAMP domain-containing histidine kinase [Ruminiclostridium sp.]|nr:HAMP domain-containing histidine kinase [Ruminiclostridium sp.]
MKAFNRIFALVIAVIILIFIGSNILLLTKDTADTGRPYRVEISRLKQDIEKNGLKEIDLSECEYVTGIEKYSDNFYNSESDYVICEINGELYRFDYKTSQMSNTKNILLINIILGIMSVVIICVMIYIRVKILSPFEKLKEVPYELSKGNLIIPVKESKNRFFGRFIWGVDLLRENIEQQKEKELNLHKEKQTLLLSLSHDIKTPLSAIKLYSKALSRGLYSDKEKQLEIADNINSKADEIESFVSQIVKASSDDFLSLEVNNGEFYLSELINSISVYYSEKLSLIHTQFSVAEYGNCILEGDIDRSVEVLQNITENAIKYGDGKEIGISFSEEENCQLITVKNSGCTLSETELPNIFDSFWRGSNAEEGKGSGLGLYICRKLMNKMNGEIFAEIKDGYMLVTAVFKKA